MLPAGLNNDRSRVGNTGHAGVCDEGNSLAGLYFIENKLNAEAFVKTVAAYQIAADLITIQQNARMTGVFREDNINIAERFQTPGRHIPKVSNRCSNNVKAGFHRIGAR